MLKCLSVFAVLLFFWSGSLLSQNTEAQLAETLQAIDRSVRCIDSLGPYTLRSLDNSWFTANSDTAGKHQHFLVGHYKKNELVKMVYTVVFTYGTSTETWYFSKGALLLNRLRIDVYPKRRGNQSKRSVVTAEPKHKCVSYFNGQDLLEFRNFGKGPMEGLQRQERRDLLLKRTQLLMLLLP